jgi:hypothetical protein
MEKYRKDLYSDAQEMVKKIFPSFMMPTVNREIFASVLFS